MTAQITPLKFDSQPPLTWPSVSLCMIVKNEAAHLADCLASVADFAQEIIIVDTGSTDDTVEIAHSWGATVRHFVWIDDFAAARNESIRAATGDWIFWMDADDRLTPENLNRLKQAAASGQADAYICQVASQGLGPDQSSMVIEHMRLFRNGLGLHFEDPLHEQVAPLAKRLGLAIARTNITITHTGYEVDRQSLQAKARRNRPIIEQCLRRAPDSLYWRFYLGVTFYALEDWSGAIVNLAPVITQRCDWLNRYQIYEAHVLLIAAYKNGGCPALAQQTLQQALLRFPKEAHLAILAGKFFLSQHKPQQAIQALIRAGKLLSEPALAAANSPDEPVSLGLAWSEGALELWLCRAYYQLGQHCYKRGDYPGMVEALTISAELASRATQLGPTERSDVYKLLAVGLQKMGREEDALFCWQTAQTFRAEDLPIKA